LPSAFYSSLIAAAGTFVIRSGRFAERPASFGDFMGQIIEHQQIFFEMIVTYLFGIEV